MRSNDTAAQRQLDDLTADLALLRRQLDAAFDELEARVEAAEARASAAEARASVAEARATVAETRAIDAEVRVHELLDLVAGPDGRREDDDGDEVGNSPLRSAFGRLRNRLDAG